MSEDRWRTRLRWVVAHPHHPQVLLARRDGALVLPETERPGQVWTADPAEVLPALVELLGADALLLDCLDGRQDPAARVQRATLLAVPREVAAPPDGMAWVGRDGLAGAAADGLATDAALAAGVVEALERGARQLAELQSDFATATLPNAQKLEQSLTGLERMLTDALLSATGSDQLDALTQEVEKQLKPYRKQMEPAIYEQTRNNLLLKRLRETFGVPRLSLFYI